MTFWTEKLNTPACVPSLGGARAFNPRESRANPRTRAFWAAQAVRIRAIRARSGATPRASHGSRTRQATAAERACQFQGAQEAPGPRLKSDITRAYAYPVPISPAQMANHFGTVR